MPLLYFNFFMLFQTQLEMLSLLLLSAILENLFDAPAFSQGLLLLGLIYKNELLSIHQSWYEYIYFHSCGSVFLWLVLGDILLCALVGAIYLDRSCFTLWFFFICNILLVKNTLEILTTLHMSALSLRALSCVVFTPWFIILRAGLQESGSLESWILCGSFFILLSLSAFGAPIFTKWALLPFDWKEEK